MTADRTSLGELARLFLKLGVIAFGGPAAHIAMLEDEVVTRRRWMNHEHFLDLIGATNLIPGPNSTEMTMHIGYERRGWAGLLIAGGCFIFPAALITGVLAWLYVAYGTLPAVEPFLIGIKPAVLAVILGALWKLGKKALKSWALVPIGVGVAVALWLGMGEVPALLLGGLIGMGLLLLLDRREDPTKPAQALLAGLMPKGTGWALLGASTTAGAVSLWKLGLFFLKVGAILYGSGYVLIAFLEGGLVNDYGWLTQAQLLDAIAIGQFTPGPVLTTSTFIGYVVMAEQGASLAIAGAVVATVGIFLPSFFFVAILNPIIPRLRQSRYTAAFLDAVNVSAVALMVVVTLALGQATLTGWVPVVVFALALVGAFGFRLNAAYLVVGGAVLGWLLTLL